MATNRPTQYEVGITVNGTTRVVGYSARRTKQSLAIWARCCSNWILSNIPADEDPIPAYDAKWGWQFGPVRVHFTGGTELHPSPYAAA